MATILYMNRHLRRGTARALEIGGGDDLHVHPPKLLTARIRAPAKPELHGQSHPARRIAHGDPIRRLILGRFPPR